MTALERQKRLYYKRRAQGLCTQCGKGRDCEGLKCRACLDGNRAARKRYYEKNPDAVRRYALKHHYGLSPEEWTALQSSQGGGCAVCGCQQKLVVDHDHDTGAIRGLLCNGCNVGLGAFRDDPDRLQRAIAYLVRESKRNAA